MTAEATSTDNSKDNTGAESGERHEFQAEISRLLHILIHSVYSDKDIFLRELISNASDACDKLRHMSVTDTALTEGDTEFRIRITTDPENRALVIADNGIGMDKDDLVSNLGTIARSGTDAFLSALSGDSKSDMSLIGQFGVGFYSAFMVADRVRVTSRKAGTDEAWSWISDGMGAYTIAKADETGDMISSRGTAIRLHLREGDDAYLKTDHLRRVVKTYSDHISFPISLIAPEEPDSEEEDKSAEEPTEEILNSSGALWAKPKSDITEEQYTEFYRHVAHGFDEPWSTIHYRAEGRHEFIALLFIPTARPFDLFEPDRKGRVKLYVNRVYITDEASFLPPYLRFVRGVVDSSDIPLTISREMLQNNPLVTAIGSSLVKKILGDLETCAKKDAERYEGFWDAFGAVLKEGLYEDFQRRDQLLELARFKTTKSDGKWRSLKDIVADFADNQTALYYVTGENQDAAAASPQLEGFKARNIEVLLLSDPVDSFWASAIDGYDGKPFKSVTRGAADLETVGKAPEKPEAEQKIDETSLGLLIASFKQTLGDAIKDVRKSDRLTSSAVCLVADDTGPDMHIEKLLRSQNLGGTLPASHVLEVNPDHPVITALADRAKQGADKHVEDAAHLLLEQARMQQGETVSDPAAFARRLQDMLVRAL